MKISELGTHQCRWIDGEAGVEAEYCGCEIVPTTSWCAEHLERVYGKRKAKTIIRRELTRWENGNLIVPRIAGKMTMKECLAEDPERTMELCDGRI